MDADIILLQPGSPIQAHAGPDLMSPGTSAQRRPADVRSQHTLALRLGPE